jgi:hypothetical protein
MMRNNFEVESTFVVEMYTSENSRGALRGHTPAEWGTPELLWAEARGKTFPLKKNI